MGLSLIRKTAVDWQSSFAKSIKKAIDNLKKKRGLKEDPSKQLPAITQRLQTTRIMTH